MPDMRTQPVVDITRASSARARARRQMRDLAAAARTAAAAAAHPDAMHPALDEPPPHGGRAWLNGQELGGYDRRYAHLTRAYE
jgi:hypothetical protein